MNFVSKNFKFFLLSSHCWAVFIFTVSFGLANTYPFWQASLLFFVLSHFVLQVFMQHWDRGISGRLQRVSAPIEQGCEISVHSDQMDPLPEEQQSQQATPMNPTAYRSMRDHIRPPRVSAPSCIIPHAEDVAVRPYLVPLLPTFHGMENENPYTHIRDFEEVCITFKEGTIDMDLLKLKAFSLTLKDKAKIWLNSLRLRTLRS